MKLDVIELEDQKDYVILDTKEIDNNKYLLLQEVNDDNNICIRKSIIENNEEYISMLEEKEYAKVLKEFSQE